MLYCLAVYVVCASCLLTRMTEDRVKVCQQAQQAQQGVDMFSVLYFLDPHKAFAAQDQTEV